jgi:hypothetical protein
MLAIREAHTATAGNAVAAITKSARPAEDAGLTSSPTPTTATTVLARAKTIPIQCGRGSNSEGGSTSDLVSPDPSARFRRPEGEVAAELACSVASEVAPGDGTDGGVAWRVQTSLMINNSTALIRVLRGQSAWTIRSFGERIVEEIQECGSRPSAQRIGDPKHLKIVGPLGGRGDLANGPSGADLRVGSRRHVSQPQHRVD